MGFSRHHSALVLASLITVAAFVAATAYTQNRLATLDVLSTTIETNAAPSLEYLGRAGVGLRRLRQLLYDGGFEIERVVRTIGTASGPARDVLAFAALLANIPGLDALSRYTRTEELLFKIRKNLFETLTFAARKPKTV